MNQIEFTEIGVLKVGHAQNFEAATGCTVIINEKGATVSVDVRGGAPGTRETDLLNPVSLIQKVHAIFLAGGSAFGLDAAAGVMQYLEEKKSVLMPTLLPCRLYAGQCCSIYRSVTTGSGRTKKWDIRPV